MREFCAGKQLGQFLVTDALVDLFDKIKVLLESAHEADQLGTLNAAGGFTVAYDHAFRGSTDHDLVEFALILDVLLEAAFLDLEKRRLRNVDIVALDEFRHMAEEKGEQQGADVRAVDVGIGHEDDFAVANLGGVEVVLADAAAKSRDHGANFFVAQHLVVARFFNIENFTLERQDGLEAAIAALLGGAACTFTLYQVELAAAWIAFAAVGKLSGQASAIQRTFAAGEVACFACSFTGAGSLNGLVDDLSRDGRVLLEESAKALVNECLHGSGDVRVELTLGLSFELRLREFNAHHCHKPFAHVVAAQVLFHVFEEAERLPDCVDGAGERGAKPGEVRAAIDGIDVIGKAENGLGIAVVVLQRDFKFDGVARGLRSEERRVGKE